VLHTLTQTGVFPSILERSQRCYYFRVSGHRCEELIVLNQAVIDAMTEAYLVKRHLETAKQNNEDTHALALELHMAYAKERQAVVVRDRHKQTHGCGGGLMRAAGF